MKLYIIRHGLTNSLDHNSYQPPDEPLNENGLRQAEAVAKRFKDLKMDWYLASPFKRALQTAEKFKQNFEVTPLLQEVKRPSEFIGKSFDDENNLKILDEIDSRSLTDPGWHYSDEENFLDAKKRTIEAIEYMRSKKQEKVLIISHGHFISILFGIMLYGKDLPAEVYLKLMKFLMMDNTGVSICEYKEEKKRWKLVCWNDTTHWPKG